MYHLFLATPEKVIFDDKVISLIAPGGDGYLEILTNHASILTTLTAGKLEVTDKDKKKWIWAVSGGFLEVIHNQAVLLADAIELPSEIDIKRAETALDQARERLESQEADIDRERAKKALLRSKNRIKIARAFK
jgi:F-type H+-transporting ATPase subunit epsilon